MVYFVFTYFCGAVYDENAYGKIKLAVVSTLLICEITRGIFADPSERSGKNLFSILTESAWKYSKEIEHSDVNLGHLERLLLWPGKSSAGGAVLRKTKRQLGEDEKQSEKRVYECVGG